MSDLPKRPEPDCQTERIEKNAHDEWQRDVLPAHTAASVTAYADAMEAEVERLRAKLAEAEDVIAEANSPPGTNDTYRLRVFPKAKAYADKHIAAAQAAKQAGESDDDR